MGGAIYFWNFMLCLFATLCYLFGSRSLAAVQCYQNFIMNCTLLLVDYIAVKGTMLLGFKVWNWMIEDVNQARGIY